MKRYKIYAIALLTGLFQTACSDMFDKKPLGAYTEDDLTGGTYETEVFSMYGWQIRIQHCSVLLS